MAEINVKKGKLKAIPVIDWKRFLLTPLHAGILGYFLFLFVVVFTKLLSALINPDTKFIIE